MSSAIRVVSGIVVFTFFVFAMFTMVSSTFPEFAIDLPLPDVGLIGNPPEDLFATPTNPPVCVIVVDMCFNVIVYWLQVAGNFIGGIFLYLGTVIWSLGTVLVGFTSFNIPVLDNAPFPINFIDDVIRIMIWVAISLTIFKIVVGIWSGFD